MILVYGEGIWECYLIKIKLFAGKNEIWFMIFRLEARSLWEYYWMGGCILKLQIFKMLGNMIKFGTWIIKIGYKNWRV